MGRTKRTSTVVNQLNQFLGRDKPSVLHLINLMKDAADSSLVRKKNTNSKVFAKK
jgi:hypothetical protein